MLVFHGEMGAPGGFLGVSVFFTLSGYLITALLLKEHAQTGQISMRGFYGRRLRRLMPASFLCFALVLGLGPLWTATQRRELPGDLLASMLDVVNWRFAFATTSYQELFIGAPSPVQHFWSLAIEEQFYLLLPIIAVVALRRSRRTLTMAAWLLLAASITATLLTTDRDLIYNGTHTRAAELLFGVVLALMPLRRRAVQRVLRFAAPVALSALIVLTLKATISDSWLYEGGLVVVGLTSAILIGGVAHGGPLSRVLGNPTLAALGRISYGLYLFHWPLFLVLDEERLGFGGLALFAVRVSASMLAAVISYWLIERPVRHRRRLVSPRLARVTALTSLGILIVAALVAVPDPRFTETEALLEQGAEAEIIPLTPTPGSASARLLSEQGGPLTVDELEPEDTEATTSTLAPLDSTAVPDDDPTTTVEEVIAEPAPLRVLVVGNDPGPLAPLESAGYDVVDGLERECPVSTTVALKAEDGTIIDTSDCQPSWIEWARKLRAASPDAVVVSTGAIDRLPSRGPNDDDFPAEGSLLEGAARLDAEEEDLRAALEVLADAAVDVWIVDHRGDQPKGLLDDRLARVGLTDRTVHDVVASDDALIAAMKETLSPVEEPARTLRVLVIGDSVSLNFARGLADGVPGTLDVVWAGENGCPFARVEATRVSTDSDWETNRCRPFDKKLPPILDEFEPDIVVMMVSLRELADQLYVGDDVPHAPGDEVFVAFHDSEMAALMALLDPRGIPLLVTDAPPIIPGAMASEEMADQNRLDAWNAQIHRWADSSATIDLLEYATPLLAYEAEHGRIRTDGVHPEIDPLTDLAATVFVPAVVAQAAALEASAAGG